MTATAQNSLLTRIAPDMQAVDLVIKQSLLSEVALINTIGDYIVAAGGKRLRPALLVLFARALGYTGKYHHQLAAVVEFIHTATLLHDDVVDESALRRGRQTANAMFGNAASVLVGDFLYSRAFQMMVRVDNMRVMQILSNATNVIAEGEVLQLLNMHDPDITEEAYFTVILYKTAELFEAAARLGAVIAQATPEQEEAAAGFGRHLGIAFQLIDDVLDYNGNSEEMGKNAGDDLREGKMTLPLIHVLSQGTAAEQDLIRAAVKDGNSEQFEAIFAAIQRCSSLDYTRERARQEAQQAANLLQHFPATPFRDTLEELCRFAVDRSA